MYKKILVIDEIEAGRSLLNALQVSGFPIQEAFWYEFPSLEWRLVIATPAIGRKGPLDPYTLVQRLLKEIQSPLSLSDISLRNPRTWSYEQIRQSALGLGRADKGRTTNSKDVAFSDAYLYGSLESPASAVQLTDPA